MNGRTTGRAGSSSTGSPPLPSPPPPPILSRLVYLPPLALRPLGSTSTGPSVGNDFVDIHHLDLHYLHLHDDARHFQYPLYKQWNDHLLMTTMCYIQSDVEKMTRLLLALLFIVNC